jgi:hypothetical protein
MDRQPDGEKGPESSPPENAHKTVIIIMTIVMVAIPLALGTLRLLGYL